ncbi:17641_t:CDS:2 [Gigaspora margarita]|uniref:17641_t:CDS:1 n=1 Tax=Gigaspora margarita TaxID=4874 RepID=A0ABM8VXE8_GIGMA|nr:17641_t:CDS:2 [Gigaspora margarita]
MSHLFRSKIAIENHPELSKFEIALSAPLSLEIITPSLLSAEATGQLLYSLYHKLNYLFAYLNYQIKITEKNPQIDKNTIQDEDNTVCWNFAKKGDLEIWQPKIAALKEILNKLGLTNIRFSLRKKNGNNHSTLPLKSPTEKAPKKILVHTLDGISNAADYVKSARAKNYAALAITDHYNVQIFPEFSQEQTEDLRIIYGCELEMLEDDLPPYIFNHNSATNQKLLTVPITALTYCVFDLETTGFFAAYNEIIEIGYVIYQNGKIIREGEYLVCPEKPIAPEILANWYTDIDPKELKKAPKINQILPRLKKEWENCVLELPYPVIDTLPLAWILLPERKSYSLERLSRMSGKDKIKQTHRALDDKETKKLINHEYFPNRGQRVKVLVTNQVGLNNLYRLITLSHTQRLFRVPCVFRSDLVKHRAGLLIGAAGGREGEMFALFSSFTDQEKIREKMRFYDYVEVNSPEKDVKDMARRIITMAEALDMLIIASHNVHYCEKKEKLLKQIIVANEGMNNTKHYLYYEATWEGKQDRFADLPLQHLLTLEEMVSNWSFLGEKNQLEKILFQNPQKIVNLIGKVDIKQPPLNYSATENVRGGENDLITAYTQRANELFEGEKSPDIDLNFSGDYQKSAHNYVRQLLGEDAVYRIGTINTLSQQTAEIFFREHLQLRKKLNPNFAEEK